MTDEQIAVAEQKDPGFEGDIRRLQNRLLDERRGLCSLLESGTNPDDRITAQVDAVIDAHNALEQRLIRYILIMREHFTPQQQERLIGLCRRNCSNTECPRQQNG